MIFGYEASFVTLEMYCMASFVGDSMVVAYTSSDEFLHNIGALADRDHRTSSLFQEILLASLVASLAACASALLRASCGNEDMDVPASFAAFVA